MNERILQTIGENGELTSRGANRIGGLSEIDKKSRIDSWSNMRVKLVHRLHSVHCENRVDPRTTSSVRVNFSRDYWQNVRIDNNGLLAQTLALEHNLRTPSEWSYHEMLWTKESQCKVPCSTCTMRQLPDLY